MSLLLNTLLSATLLSTGALSTPTPEPEPAAATCDRVSVFQDLDGDGRQGAGEPPMAGAKVSDGRTIVVTGADGHARLPAGNGPRTAYVIKPAGYAFARRIDGLPDAWRTAADARASATQASDACRGIGLQREILRERSSQSLRVLVFADPQPKSSQDVGYYQRDIVAPIVAGAGSRTGQGPWPGSAADLGLSLGDIVDDDLSLYPAVNRVTATLGVPWLHVAGNHDVDRGVARDEDSLQTFRHHYGPDTLAWEEPEANFVVLDDVIYMPGNKPAYIGGFREDQFAFLERYLASADKRRLLVLAVHIPLFEEPGRDSFRDADRERLFALLHDFPHVLLLSAHNHTQRHVFHDAATGWRGTAPLHEYNVGAACGAYWSGVKDFAGIPDATMADGTPNGYSRLDVRNDGTYALSWHNARGQGGGAIGLHAPAVLRKGAYPAFGVFANVYMGRDDTRVEFRVDSGEWKPMRKVERPDPRLLAENATDDSAGSLRGYDRSPEAEPSAHLWRGALPTDLALGEHAVEVRAFDPWQGVQRASTSYRLEDAPPP